MNLGWVDVCLGVENAKVSAEFYQQLGFKMVDGNLDENWAVLTYDQFRLGLYGKEHMGDQGFCLNFRGSDIRETLKFAQKNNMSIVKETKVNEDGSGYFHLSDPDGFELFFDSVPGETKPE